MLNGTNYYFIKNAQIALLEYDLIRIKWMEKLKIVQLYLLIGNAELDKKIMTSEGPILQNRWVYDQVTKVIPTNRVAIIDPNFNFCLPELPQKHHVAHATTKPPSSKEVG